MRVVRASPIRKQREGRRTGKRSVCGAMSDRIQGRFINGWRFGTREGGASSRNRLGLHNRSRSRASGHATRGPDERHRDARRHGDAARHDHPDALRDPGRRCVTPPNPRTDGRAKEWRWVRVHANDKKSTTKTHKVLTRWVDENARNAMKRLGRRVELGEHPCQIDRGRPFRLVFPCPNPESDHARASDVESASFSFRTFLFLRLVLPFHKRKEMETQKAKAIQNTRKRFGPTRVSQSLSLLLGLRRLPDHARRPPGTSPRATRGKTRHRPAG